MDEVVRISYTLAGEGPSDRALVPVVEWCLTHTELATKCSFVSQVAPSSAGPLQRRVDAAVRAYPCNLLLVHRDGDREGYHNRCREVEHVSVPVATLLVPLVPVRTMEAWLLIEEDAIRVAAGNPRGDRPLSLPAVRALEDVADPKSVLANALLEAAEVTGRRRRKFQRQMGEAIQRVAVTIADFAPLRRLDAFRQFETSLVSALQTTVERLTGPADSARQ